MSSTVYKIVAHYKGDINEVMKLPSVCPEGHGLFDGETLIKECLAREGFSYEEPGYDALGYVDIWSGDDCPPFECKIDGKEYLGYLSFIEYPLNEWDVKYELADLLILEK